MIRISNPHDKFFKGIFTRKGTAKEFLQHYLPENVVALLDLNSSIPQSLNLPSIPSSIHPIIHSSSGIYA